MGELAKLVNIGVVIEEQLNSAGITSYDQLKELGSKEAWLKIRAIDSSACLHRLCALEGAIQGVKKSLLSQESKADLQDFYRFFNS